MLSDSAVRHPDLITLDPGTPRRSVRSQNFQIEWIEVAPGQPALDLSSATEVMLLLFDCTARIAGESQTAQAPRRSVTVLPAGAFRIEFEGTGRACVISTERQGMPEPLNAESYARPNPRVAAVGPAWARTGDARRIQIFDIDRVKAPATNPRIKMFQSATISINWVDYQGPRDRAALSPHSHADLEQASLAAAGDFVHHLRVAWGKNANEWRDDEHIRVGSPSVLVIPPDVIHTTEGVGPGHHLLIDVFAPPRRDFIAKGWVENSAEYRDPQKG
jgi:mannose-6-phosphate isomerase-like protein (cupin superfamily)